MGCPPPTGLEPIFSPRPRTVALSMPIAGQQRHTQLQPALIRIKAQCSKACNSGWRSGRSKGRNEEGGCTRTQALHSVSRGTRTLSGFLSHRWHREQPLQLCLVAAARHRTAVHAPPQWKSTQEACTLQSADVNIIPPPALECAKREAGRCAGPACTPTKKKLGPAGALPAGRKRLFGGARLDGQPTWLYHRTE